MIDVPAAAQYGVELADLAAHGHRGGAAKFVAVELACRLTGMTGRAVGAHYGGISSAAVSIIRRKIREGNYDLVPVVRQLLAKIHKTETRKGQT